MATPINTDVKSTAVVQYSSMKMPVQFSTIGLNTDLNHPPTGWPVYTNFQQRQSRNFSPFLSLNMADAYPNLVGQVDVISSSKIIRELLKMQFGGLPRISIMVHRLGKTLLLEEFDVYNHLIKKEEEEWNWLKTYFHDVIAKRGDGKFSKYLNDAPPPTDATQNQMYMNLIRHSFAASESVSPCAVVASPAEDTKLRKLKAFFDCSQDLKGFHHETMWEFEDISMLIDSDLPIFGGEGPNYRPCISLRLRDSHSPPINVLTGLDYWLDNLMSNVPEVAMVYHVNGFVQKYEVMKTADIPHLENSCFNPEDVLDIARNIMSFIKRNAVVEGHTYWLYKDESVDTVKLYDLTDVCKEQQLVSGENPFTVPVGLLCHRVATNLRKSGQRRNADSRTMFENCIRLLDDSKYGQNCSSYIQECADAHYQLSDMWVPDKSVIDIWQEGGKISDPPSDLYDEDETDSDEIFNSTDEDVNLTSTEEGKLVNLMSTEEGKLVKHTSTGDEKSSCAVMKGLVVRGMVKHKAWETVKADRRIAGTTDQRCRQALDHIRKGLSCIDKELLRGKTVVQPEKYSRKAQSSPPRAQNSRCDAQASPSRVIPLPYSPIKCTSTYTEDPELIVPNPQQAIPLPYKNSTGEKSSSSDGSNKMRKNTQDSKDSDKAGKATSNNSETDSSTEDELSWCKLAKFQLLKKAAITYFVLAKEFFGIKKYGHSLRHLRYAMHCFESMEHLDSSSNVRDTELYMMLLYLAGQTRSCLYTCWASAKHDFEELGETEAAILHSAQLILSKPKMSWVYTWSQSLEANMSTAAELFEKTLKLPLTEKKPKSFQTAIKKDYASCMMNLGNVQMEACKGNILNDNKTLKPMKSSLDKALDSFHRAIKLFDSVGERNHAAHNYSNVAYVYNLMSIAVYNSLGPDEILPPAQLEFLFKNAEWMEKSANHYEIGEKNDEFREQRYSNLRCLYQEMAVAYFRKSASAITDQEYENMKEFLQKSLKYCFLDSVSNSLRMRRAVGACNYLNMAKVLQLESHKTRNPTRRRHLRQKIGENFQKSISLYKQIGWHRSAVCATVVWTDAIVEEAPDTGKKKSIRTALLHLCDLKTSFEVFLSGEQAKDDAAPTAETDLNVVNHMNGIFTYLIKLNGLDKNVKLYYGRCLRLTTIKEEVDLFNKLIEFFTDLKDAIDTGAILS